MRVSVDESGRERGIAEIDDLRSGGHGGARAYAQYSRAGHNY